MKKIVFFLLLAVIATIAPLTLSAQNGEHNGHRYVDLGLPSGTKWADCNVGASSPTEYGNYYAWGETATKSKYNWDTYKYGYGWNELTKYCTRVDYGKNGFNDNKTELDLSDDVAHTQWGGQWRMPTIEQFDELKKHTTSKWTSINNVWGRLFTAKNGNSIFLPASTAGSFIYPGSFGDYWSRTLRADYPNYAFKLYFYSDDMDVGYSYRNSGQTVRPVYDKNTPVESSNILKVSGTDNGHRYVDLGLPSGTKWADCNVGASSSSQYGNYYAWGETATKSIYNWDTYKYGNYDKLTKYCTESDNGLNGFTDGKTELVLDDDVAHKQWGGQWRMPTKEQFYELQKHTTSKWTSINNVWGRLFTAKNGNSIFLPATGYRYDTSLYYAGSVGDYWSRTLDADYPGYAYYLSFGSGGVDVGSGDRDIGHTVRPVRP